MLGDNGLKPPSKRSAARRSEVLAGSTRQAIGKPNVSTRMWRLRPFTSLCPSKPRTPPRSVALTDCPLQTCPHAGVLPRTEIVIHGAPGWKLARKETPLAAGAQQIEDRVDHGPNIGGAWPPAGVGLPATAGRAVPMLRRSHPWHKDCLALSIFAKPSVAAEMAWNFSNTLLSRNYSVVKSIVALLLPNLSSLTPYRSVMPSMRLASGVPFAYRTWRLPRIPKPLPPAIIAGTL